MHFVSTSVLLLRGFFPVVHEGAHQLLKVLKVSAVSVWDSKKCGMPWSSSAGIHIPVPLLQYPLLHREIRREREKVHLVIEIFFLILKEIWTIIFHYLMILFPLPAFSSPSFYLLKNLNDGVLWSAVGFWTGFCMWQVVTSGKHPSVIGQHNQVASHGSICCSW